MKIKFVQTGDIAEYSKGTVGSCAICNMSISYEVEYYEFLTFKAIERKMRCHLCVDCFHFYIKIPTSNTIDCAICDETFKVVDEVLGLCKAPEKGDAISINNWHIKCFNEFSGLEIDYP
jgi:hypothetical protein